MHEPELPARQRHVIAAAAAWQDRLVAFCRVDPPKGPVAEIRRSIAAARLAEDDAPRAPIRRSVFELIALA